MYDGTDVNNDDHAIPSSLYGRIPHVELYTWDMLPTLKIVGLLPNEGNTNYSFRIIGFWPDWWDSEYNEERYSNSEIDEEEFTEFMKGADEPNIYVWDYNIQTNTFEITNILLLTKLDGTIIQYSWSTASEDGKELFFYSETEGLVACLI